MLQFTLIKFLLHLLLETAQTGLSTISDIFVLISQHEDQLLQKFGQVHQQIYAYDLIQDIDPDDQELPDSWVLALKLGFEGEHELLHVEILQVL